MPRQRRFQVCDDVTECSDWPLSLLASPTRGTKKTAVSAVPMESPESTKPLMTQQVPKFAYAPAIYHTITRG